MLSSIVAILIVVVAALAGALGQIIVARRISVEAREPINTVGGVLYASVVGAFGVLLAFVISAVWAQFDAAKQVVETEANLLVGVSLEAGAFAEPARGRLRDDVRKYMDAVVQKEWPSMAEASRGESLEARAALHKLWSDAIAVPIASDDPRQSTAYDHVVEHIHDATGQRQLRLLAARDSIHSGLWIVLALGAGMTVAFAWFFGVKGTSPRAHPLMAGALSGFIAACLVAVAALDHPFEGASGISSEAFKRAGEVIEYASAAKP